MRKQQLTYGRNISLNIDYEDILAADSFHADLLEFILGDVVHFHHRPGGKAGLGIAFVPAVPPAEEPFVAEAGQPAAVVRTTAPATDWGRVKILLMIVQKLMIKLINIFIVKIVKLL